MTIISKRWIWLLEICLVLAWGCGGDGDASAGPDDDVDGDSDLDSDTDTGTNTDENSDSDTNDKPDSGVDGGAGPCAKGTLSSKDFVIAGSADVEYLSGYTSIMGRLKIVGTNLVDLKGLECLTSIREALDISENTELINLRGLEGLKSIGNLTLTYNPLLEDLSGLENLESAVGLSINFNESLKTISALSNLKGLVTDPWDMGGMESLLFSGNPALKNLDGLEGLTSVEDQIFIVANDSLENISALRNVSSRLNGTLYVEANPKLVSLHGLEGITYVDFTLTIMDNDSLSNLEGLNGIDKVLNFEGPGPAIVVQDNDSLESLTGLDKLTSVGGDLAISDNSSLNQCDVCEFYEELTANGNTGACSCGDNKPDTCEENCGTGDAGI